MGTGGGRAFSRMIAPVGHDVVGGRVDVLVLLGEYLQ